MKVEHEHERAALGHDDLAVLVRHRRPLPGVGQKGRGVVERVERALCFGFFWFG
jgi:hypothetical protein